MNNSLIIRNFKLGDTAQVLEIYNFHIKNGLGNFEENLIEFQYFYDFCTKILDSKLPFLICEKNKIIIGFAYLSKFREKSGYRFTFENSIYIDNKYIVKGIGNKLLRELVKISKNNIKIKTIIAVIGGNSSIASIKIHEKNGFKIIGTLKDVGFKKNEWLDSIYMQKILYEKN